MQRHGDERGDPDAGPDKKPKAEPEPGNSHRIGGRNTGPEVAAKAEGRRFDADFTIIGHVLNGVDGVVAEHPGHAPGIDKSKRDRRWRPAGGGPSKRYAP